MKKNENIKSDLRKKAESSFNKSKININNMPIIDIQSLIQELQIHQIELKMQNEQLLQTQIELAQSKDNYVELFELAPVGYIIFNNERIIEEINLTVSKMLGLDRKKLIGVPLSKYIAKESQDEFHRLFYEFSDINDKVSSDIEMIKPDKKTLFVHLEIIKQTQRGDNSIIYRAALSDITEKKLKEKAHIETELHKEQFLAVLGHELRNPLAAIQSGLDLLERKEIKEPHIKKTIAAFSYEIHKISAIVNDLLNISQLMTGKSALYKKTLKLQDEILLANEKVNELATKKKITVTIKMPDEPIWVDADHVRLGQIFINILENAIKFTNMAGYIYITVIYDNSTQFVKISVKDTGSGMAPEKISHIFGLFEKLNYTVGGLGIGLALAERFTHLHGGSIVAKSCGLGKGSEFIISLPVCLNPVIKVGNKESFIPVQEKENIISKKKILLVDDNKLFVDELAELLQDTGYEIVTAYTGKKALKTAAAFKPDIVILDIGLPDMDGYELARKLKNIPELVSTIFIALSGYNKKDMEKDIEDNIIAHYLIKPLKIDKLEKLLKNLTNDAK